MNAQITALAVLALASTITVTGSASSLAAGRDGPASAARTSFAEHRSGCRPLGPYGYPQGSERVHLRPRDFTTNDDGEHTVTGRDADRAARAALGFIDGGRANSVERDSESGAIWEVEVSRADGSTVDVGLEEKHELVVIETDSEQV